MVPVTAVVKNSAGEPLKDVDVIFNSDGLTVQSEMTRTDENGRAYIVTTAQKANPYSVSARVADSEEKTLSLDFVPDAQKARLSKALVPSQGDITAPQEVYGVIVDQFDNPVSGLSMKLQMTPDYHQGVTINGISATGGTVVETSVSDQYGQVKAEVKSDAVRTFEIIAWVYDHYPQDALRRTLNFIDLGANQPVTIILSAERVGSGMKPERRWSARVSRGGAAVVNEDICFETWDYSVLSYGANYYVGKTNNNGEETASDSLMWDGNWVLKAALCPGGNYQDINWAAITPYPIP